MKTIGLIIIMQFLGLLFLMIPYDLLNIPIVVNHWIPFNDFGEWDLERSTYVWMFFQRCKWVFVYIIIALRTRDIYTNIILIFASFEALKIIDFMLSYNTPWYTLPFFGNVGLGHLFIAFGWIIYFILKWNKQRDSI